MDALTEIENIFTSNVIFIKKSKILKWQKSSDYEVLGALVELILNQKFYSKITPKLTLQDYYPFIFNYYLTCMQNDFDGEWVNTPYIAAYELKNFIAELWLDKNKISRKELKGIQKNIKIELENICLNAKYTFKEVLINGLFEHLFENKNIRNDFKDWKSKDKLKIFYECAIDKSKEII